MVAAVGRSERRLNMMWLLYVVGAMLSLSTFAAAVGYAGTMAFIYAEIYL